jgi:hypothetical protein
MSGSESELLFAIAFFDRRLPGDLWRVSGQRVAVKLPGAAYGPEGEALVLPQLQGHTGRASVAEAN